MRSALAVALVAATVVPGAFAASPNYTTPIHAERASRPAATLLTFRNTTPQERELHVAGTVYKLNSNRTVRIAVPAGEAVRVTSDVNSKVNRELAEVAGASRADTILVQ